MTNDRTSIKSQSQTNLLELIVNPHDSPLEIVPGWDSSGMEIGDWVKEERLRLGLTQAELGEFLRITDRHVSNIERGRVERISDLVFARMIMIFRPPPEEVARKQLGDRKLPADEFLPVSEPISSKATEKEKADHLADFIAQVKYRDEQIERIRSGRIRDESNRIPLINKAPAGDPHDYGDMDYPPGVAAIDYIDRGDIPADLPVEAFTVVGDSMEPEYRHGDICIIAPDNVQEGDDCLARISNDSPKFPGQCTFKRVSFEDGKVVLKPINPAPQHRYLILDREHVILWKVIEQRRKR